MQAEVDAEARAERDGFALLFVGSKAPLPNRIGGGGGEFRVAAEQLEYFDPAILADDSFESDFPLDELLSGRFRINRFNPPNQMCASHLRGNYDRGLRLQSGVGGGRDLSEDHLSILVYH